MFHPFPEDNALVVETASLPGLFQTVPAAFEVMPGYAGMPFDLDSCIRLAATGLRPPSPIEFDYAWPRDPVQIPQPFAHQVQTAAFLTTNPRAYCLNDIGTGKSITTAWAADYLMTAGYVRRVLIAAPLSTLERVWGDTIFFHLRHRSAAVLHGSAARRRKLLAEPHDFYIINHDGIGVIQKDLMARDDIDLVIIDESAVYRKNNTERWKAMDKVVYPTGGRPRPWVWGLTGKPIPNEPTDAFGQCKLITPTTVPKFFSQFRNMVMEHQSTYVWTPRQEATSIVHASMRPSIRFKRDECLDLPGEIHSEREVEFSAEQKKHYKEIMNELYTEVRGGKVNAVNEGVKLSKLMQIACGVVYDMNGVPIEIDPGSRVETLLEVIEQCDEKVIVFVPFTEVTNMLYREVSKHWSAAVVYGDVNKKERDQIFSDFQKLPDPSVLIAHPACMAHGLTLVRASTIVWYAPVPSNDLYEQANGRITRPGQRYVANIVHLSGSAVERKAYKRLAARQKMQNLLLEMVERNEQ